MSNNRRSIKDKVVIVTGASSGIGRGIAQRLLEEGAKVSLAARREERLRELADDYPDSARAISTDITEPPQVRNLVKKTLDAFGCVDILINNAGVGHYAPMDEAKLDHWNNMMDVNVKGMLNCIHASLPCLKETGGHIVNISSVAAHNVYPGSVVYCASKHAVHAIMRGFRKEMRDEVRITNIAPGAVDTEFPEHTDHHKYVEHFKDYFTEPLIHPEDIADSVVHVLTLPDHLVVNDYVIRPNR